MHLLTADLRYVETDESYGYVYFLSQRGGGPGKIKIGFTSICPYHRLDHGRHKYRKLPGSRYCRYELLGSILVEGREVERAIHKRFDELREEKYLGEKEWFRPGIVLLQFINEHGMPHFCGSACPNGTSVQEVWDRQQREVMDAIQKSRLRKE